MGTLAIRVLGVMAVGLFLCASGISFAQDSDTGSLEMGIDEVAAVPEMTGEPEEAGSGTAEPLAAASADEPAMSASKEAMAPQWIWGEVVSVDQATNQVQIKHLDYDTYEEVTKVIAMDSGTLYENVGGISEIKAGDAVTVDFKTKEGIRVAELMVVDKNRAAQESSASAASSSEPGAVSQEAAPEASQESVATPESSEPSMGEKIGISTAHQEFSSAEEEAAPEQLSAAEETANSV